MQQHLNLSESQTNRLQIWHHVPKPIRFPVVVTRESAPYASCYGEDSEVMTKGNLHGLWQMVPTLEPDSGTAFVLALDFVQAAVRGLWDKHVQCVDDASKSELPDPVLELRGLGWTVNSFQCRLLQGSPVCKRPTHE